MNFADIILGGILFILLSMKEVLTQPCTNSPPAEGEGAYLKFITLNHTICLKSLKVSYIRQNSSKSIEVMGCSFNKGNFSCPELDPNYKFINCSEGSLFLKILNTTKQHEGIYTLVVVGAATRVSCTLARSENKTLHINESDLNKNPVQITKNDSGHHIDIQISLVVGVRALPYLVCVIGKLWRRNKLPKCRTFQSAERSKVPPYNINMELQSLQQHPPEQNGNPPQESPSIAS